MPAEVSTARQTVLPDASTGALRVLWARRWIDEWEDGLKMATGDTSLEDRILAMALEHSILSSRTSFVAVDSLVVNKTGKLEGVDQPLPMPEGVSNSAVGGDSDGDGIPDSSDSCPSSPEVFNGIDDYDGCPDMGKVVLHACEITVVEKIYFASGSATIKEASKPLLDMIAQVMNDNPQILLVHVAGYADVKEKSAVVLSQKRAQAVVDSLVERGVDPKRLSVGGYGKHCPIDPGKKKSALEKNRRVEFVILPSK